MNVPQIISLCFLIFSVLLLLAGILWIPGKLPHLRKYLLISTALYISGTLLIAIIAFVRTAVPDLFIWLCEAFVFGIFAISSGMIVYIAKKFAEGNTPPANHKDDLE
jgi:heme/copper-type cytochrome/quinol oxidase subunit 3